MASSIVDVVRPDGTLTPLTIITKMHSSQAEVAENIRTNMKRNPIRFMQLPGLLLARNEPIAIVGGGPSLNSHIEKIKEFRQVMVCGSAHDHLVGLGVTPTFALAVDAMPDAVDYFRNPQEITSYLLASQCHPSLYEALEGHKIAMWHFKGQCDDESVFEGELQINWGCMVGVMSVQTALYLGFQELHFFGFDCCFLDNEHHSYDVGRYHEEVEERKDVFTINGRIFHSTVALVSQMEHLYDVFASPDGRYVKGYVYGTGMWAENIRASPPEMKEWLEAVP